jgi:hypothetical protein
VEEILCGRQAGLGFFYAISLEASRRNGTEFLTEKFKKNVMLK